LEEAPRHDLSEERRLCQMDTLGHRVSELLDLLESTGMNYADLAGIEWMWLPVLDRTKRGLKALDSVLSVDPRWFVEALQFAYRGDNDEPRELSQGDRARASQASRLLEQWHHVPGLADVEYPDKKKGLVKRICGRFPAPVRPRGCDIGPIPAF
jgi:hypothetical protein